MPSDEEITEVFEEIAEMVESVGDEVVDIEGPLERDDSDEGIPIDYVFYGKTQTSSYGIVASKEAKNVAAFYPFNISRYIGGAVLEEDLGNKVDLDVDPSEVDEYKYEELIGNQILENTTEGILRRARHNISAYGSSDKVSIDIDENLGGFRTTRPIYPYDSIALDELGDRIMNAVNLGERTKRYIEASFYVEEIGDEDESKLSLHIPF